jgi:hypothetical protein
VSNSLGEKPIEVDKIDLDYLVTVASTKDSDRGETLEQFGAAMDRSSRQISMQVIAINRLLTRQELAMNYLKNFSQRGLTEMNREDFLRLQAAIKALSGEHEN